MSDQGHDQGHEQEQDADLWSEIIAREPCARIDQFIAKNVKKLSRARVQKLLEEGNILLNGNPVKRHQKVQPGDRIAFYVPEPKELELIAEDIPLQILFEDEHLLVVNKPAGMVVHPAPGHYQGTLVNALLHHCGSNLAKGSLSIGGYKRPGIVHRIDKNTSGIMVVTKSDAAHAGLSADFKEHKLSRRYQGLAWGEMPEQVTIEAPIGRDPRHRQRMHVVDEGKGKPARTFFQQLERYSVACFFEATLYTGRTHQIRVHAASHGHPLIGDRLYGNLTTSARKTRVAGETKIKKNFSGLADAIMELDDRQMLHAAHLGITHPVSGESLQFDCEPPDDFQKILGQLRALTDGSR